MNNFFTIIGSVIVFMVVFGFAAYNRYLQHKETLALVEKGLLPSENSEDKSKNLLRWATIFSILGALLVLVMVPFAWNNYWILFLLGLLPLALGLGFALIYVFSQENPPPKEKKPEKETKAKPAAKKPAAKSTKAPAKKK
jgi:Na+/H+ antiporter NhaC